MRQEMDFEDIRPYRDDEINPALRRLVSNPVFSKITEYFFRDRNIEQLKKRLSEIRCSYDFQAEFMYPLVSTILEKTSGGLTYSGFDKITKGEACLFVSNHRDIVLDSAILQMLLLKQGHTTTEITFGSNLMRDDFVVDFGKINKMFKLERSGSKSELLNSSKLASEYIRYAVSEKKSSVWIAQRPGRTKDGHDKTESGLLKMFMLSNRGDFLTSIRELNIVPVSISYEYEPCCRFKIRELIETRRTGSYSKGPDEDLHSIITGITQQKGRISLVICNPVNCFIGEAQHEININKKLGRLAELIDMEIYRNYRLWPANYIAYDMLAKSSHFADKYTKEQKQKFLDYMDTETRDIDADMDKPHRIFLELYANPVSNHLKALGIKDPR